MSKLSLLMLGILGTGVLAAGCGGDDDDDGGGGEEVTFNVPLTAAEEIPLCNNAGASATGAAVVKISADNSTITVSDFTFTGLSGPASAAHIHQGAGGATSVPALPFAGVPTSPVPTVTFNATNYPASPGMGLSPDFATFVTEMRAGKTYLNVHTGGAAGCPMGEIRGQIN